MGNTLKVKRGTNLSNAGTPAAGELIYKTDTNELFVGDGSTAATGLSAIGGSGSGDIEGVTAGVGLSGGGSSGTVSLAVDLSELTDMTASVNSSEDELIILDNGADRRKLISEIPLSAFNNDSGFITTDTTLSTEQVQDIVGAMFSSNTETRISATYQDGDGTIDLVVDDMTANTVTTNIAGTGVSVSSGTGNSTISIGQSVGTSDTVAFGRVNIGSTDTSSYLSGDPKLAANGYIMVQGIVNESETGTAPAAITFGDGATLGSDQISLVTAGNRRLYVASNGNVTIAENLTVNGTIGGSAIKDQDDMSSNSATHLATQQSIKAYVDAEVAGIVNSAPAALDTLDELAAALGDDANFATTTSDALGNRLRVDTASQGLTGTQQANAITNLGITATKAELNYVDGVTSAIQTQLNSKLDTAGTGIDISSTTVSVDVSDFMSNGSNNRIVTATGADAMNAESTLTWNGSDYLNVQSADDAEGGIRLNKSTTDSSHTKWSISHRDDNQSLIIYSYDGTTFRNWINFDEPNGLLKLASATANPVTINTSGQITTGTWNGSVIASAYLDADTAHLSGSQTFSGAKTFSAGINVGGLSTGGISGSNYNITGVNAISFSDPGAGEGLTFSNFQIFESPDDLSNAAGNIQFVTGGSSGTRRATIDTSGNLYVQNNITLGGTVDGRDVASDGSKLDGIESGATADQSASEILTAIKTVDGGGSGLDADTIDGLQSSQLLRNDSNGTLDGNLTLASGHTFRTHNESSYDKYRLYGTSSAYAIGMISSTGHGAVDSWAMTFTFSTETNRGFLWRTTGHSSGQAAMSLNTEGKLNVAHSIRAGYGISDTTAPGATYALDVSGSIGATADVVAYISSDERLKENIENIKNPLEKLEKLNGVEFDWNDKQDLYQGHDIGVIAQEVEEVLPEIVDTREDGYKAVKYDRIVALLIESIKELKAEVEELKK